MRVARAGTGKLLLAGGGVTLPVMAAAANTTLPDDRTMGVTDRSAAARPVGRLVSVGTMRTISDT